MLVAGGLYVHVPFCRKRCGFCAFSVVPGHLDAAPAYVDGLLAELEYRTRQRAWAPFQTLYLGGGTPSLLPIIQLERLLGGIGRLVDFEDGAEWTIEVDPGTVDRPWLHSIQALGMNRLSLGVQSLDDDTLTRLTRTHRSRDALALLDAISEVGFPSWSADLMFGMDGGSVQGLAKDLELLLAFQPPHLSLYHLTIEPGTAFDAAVQRGGMAPPDQDMGADLLQYAHNTAEEAGLPWYEISNLARPGHSSRHNQGYWRHRPCLAIGMGACGLEETGPRSARRWRNPGSLKRYIKGAAEASEQESEELGPDLLALETLMLGLRTREGVDPARFRNLAGDTLAHVLDGPLGLEQQRGTVTWRAGRLCLSAQGVPLADAVTRSLAVPITERI